LSLEKHGDPSMVQMMGWPLGLPPQLYNLILQYILLYYYII